MWLASLTLALSLSAAERAQFERAIELQLAADLEAAESGYRSLLESRPEFVPARLYRAQTLWLLGRKEEAREELAAARPYASDLLLVPALDRTFGSGESVPPLVERILRTAPLGPNRLLATGTPALVLLSLGQAEEAIEDFRRVSALDPDDRTLHRRLGDAFFEAKLFLPAAEAFERVTALVPEDVSAWRRLGAAHLSLLRWSSAATAFENALGRGGEDPGLLLALGYAYERNAEHDRALELYRKASRLAPQSGRPPYRIGRALLALGKLEEAERALASAVEIEPSFAGPLPFLGEIHLKQGRYESAIETLLKAVSLDPDSLEAYYQLAQAYRRAGREEDARQAIVRYAELKRRHRGVSSQEEVLSQIESAKRRP